VVSFATATAICVGIHLWVEKPLQRFFKSLQGKPAKAATQLP
jgi:hypothetical protein